MTKLATAAAKFLERSTGAAASGFALWLGMTGLKMANEAKPPFDDYASWLCLALAALGAAGVVVVLARDLFKELAEVAS
jgi:hypothetical protein